MKAKTITVKVKAITPEELADSLGIGVEEARTLIGDGKPTNPDGTFDYTMTWHDPLSEPTEGCKLFKWNLDEAVSWLEWVLFVGGRPASAIIEKAEGLGLSRRTLASAKKRLGVVSKKASSAWTWELPKRKSRSNVAK